MLKEINWCDNCFVSSTTQEVQAIGLERRIDASIITEEQANAAIAEANARECGANICGRVAVLAHLMVTQRR